MKRILTWSGRIAAALALLLLLAVGAVYFASARRLNKTYTVTVRPVDVPASWDTDALARGRHIADTRGCAGCHAPDLGGKTVVSSFLIGHWTAPNLTSGPGGLPRDFSHIDYIRAIRHGLNREGRPLMLMPSHEFAHFSDRDMADLIAHLKSVPPVNRTREPFTVGPLGRALILAGKIPIPAERIDHAHLTPHTVTPGRTVEYGRYLSVGCQGCHGHDYTGGKIPGAPPAWPAAANLTPQPGNPFAKWTDADFLRAMREGRRPDGTEINRVMPWRALGKMTDDELGAIYLYLRQLPTASSTD